MAHRLTLLLSSPRVAPGLLTRDAWDVLASAAAVLARDEDEAQAVAVAESGMPVAHVGAEPPASLARLLADRTEEGEVVWLGSADGDPGLTDALAAEVSRRPEPPEVEVLVGSWDVPGARLLDLVAVMDRLRTPGVCPWYAEQTHESLLPYLIEEAYEVVEAIESGDRAHMLEELGDLLFQVVFHSRVAAEDPAAPFDVDDVAAALVDKLVRRNPHVFADVEAETAEDVTANWEQIKAQEKPHRDSPLDGIPAGLPALARADKVLSRLERAGAGQVATDATAGEDVGAQLLALVARARAAGVDAEAALRATLREVEAQVRADGA